MLSLSWRQIFNSRWDANNTQPQTTARNGAENSDTNKVNGPNIVPYSGSAIDPPTRPPKKLTQSIPIIAKATPRNPVWPIQLRPRYSPQPAPTGYHRSVATSLHRCYPSQYIASEVCQGNVPSLCPHTCGPLTLLPQCPLACCRSCPNLRSLVPPPVIGWRSRSLRLGSTKVCGRLDPNRL